MTPQFIELCSAQLAAGSVNQCWGPSECAEDMVSQALSHCDLHPPHEKNPLCEVRVLAFGDSLTAGEWTARDGDNNWWGGYEPYHKHLQRALALHMGPSFQCSIKTWHSGIPGRAAFEMLKYMDQADGLRSMLRDILAMPSGETSEIFTVVVILAGTNDLLIYGRSDEAVAASILELARASRAEGAHVLLVEIPKAKQYTSNSNAEEAENRRAKANELLRLQATGGQYNWQQSKRRVELVEGASLDSTTSVDERAFDATEPHLFFADFPLPAWEAAQEEPRSAAFWCQDGLHFTKAGYIELGERLAQTVGVFIRSKLPEDLF